MIRTRVKKILRDIWSRKARTLLVSISIFIGVFGTITLFTMGDLLVRQLEKDLDKNKLGMIRTYLATNPGAEVDNEALLSTLRGLPDVTVAEGQAVYPLFWKKEGQEEFESSTIFSYSEPFEEIQLEPTRLEEGRFPQPGQKELVIERRFAEKYDLGIGDTITVRVLSQVNGEGVPEEPWTIVGTVFFPYAYQGLNTVLPQDSVFATYEDAQYIADFTGFSSIYVRYKDFKTAKAQEQAFIGTIASSSEYIPVFSFTEDPDKNSIISFARTSGSVLASLALLALLVSGFLVLNVITAIVTEQKNQIGVMKSVGASRMDTFFMYSGIALVYGIIGVIPGVILGIPMGFFAAQGLAESSNSHIDAFGTSTRAIVLGIGMGLLVPVLASLLPVFNGTRVRIIDAITDLGISSRYGYGPLARLAALLPIPVNMRQGISNVLRKKGRMALTGFALTLAAGAFMGVFAVFTSVNTVLNDFFNTYEYHFSVMPNDASDTAAAEGLVLNNLEGLRSRGEGLGIAIKIEGYDKEYDPATGPPALFASGYDPEDEPFHLKLVDGSLLTGATQEILISRSIADAMDKGIGDTLTIHAGGRSGEYQIRGIVSFPYDGVWFDWRDLAVLAGFVDANGAPISAGFLVEMDKDDPTADEVEEVLDEVNDVLLANGISASYGNIELFTESISEGVGVFRLIFNFAALLIALVGAVGLLTTLSMSVFERQKEIGVMRSIGAGSTTIIGQFLTEGLVVGFMAWLVGLPMSYFLSAALIDSLNLGDEYKLEYPLIAVVIGFVGIMVITTIASIWPSIAAARKTVSDILRYQ